MAKGKMTRIKGFGRNKKLYQAIIEGDLQAARKAIGADILAFDLPVNVIDDTVLHVAISEGEWDIAEEILKFMDAYQLENANLKGDTPLHEVASKGILRVAEGILSKNIELLNRRNIQQETPLHKAALFGHRDMFDYLLEKGSNILARREGGATVLHCAVMGTHLELAEMIVTHMPSLCECRDQQGMTPLHLLVTNPRTFEDGIQLRTIDSFIYKRILPKEDISLYGRYEDGIEPDYIGVDEGGKQPEDGVSVVIDLKDNGLKTRSVISHLYKEMFHEKFPLNYVTCFNIGRCVHSLCSVIARWRDSALFFIASKTCPRFNKVEEMKRVHGQALRLVGFLCGRGGEYWTQLNKGRSPVESTSDTNEIVILDIKHDGKYSGGLTDADRGKELPHILAAKMGATSFVDRILTVYPKSAILTSGDGKNILQVAVEHRQEKIVRLIESTEDWRRITVSGKDKKSNTILHSAARIGYALKNLDPASALQMRREFQWFERVEKLIPWELVHDRNLEGEIAEELFTICHADMLSRSKEQLIATGQACFSLVSTVVFATSFSIPGGTDESGQALFHNKPAFKVFTITYVVGLSSAITALLLFVSLIISPSTEQEFRRSLPTKFMLTFVCLFMALAFMVVALASNIYLTTNGKGNGGDIVRLVCELTIIPAFAFAVLFRC